MTKEVKQISPITTDKDVSFTVVKYKADHTGTLNIKTPRACAASTVRPTEAKQLLNSWARCTKKIKI